jgi:AAA domain, putative AbiEii toxin, Type IV TA system
MPAVSETKSGVAEGAASGLGRAGLARLELQGVGPVHDPIELAARLTLLLGENGLGKTLVLDVLWWALTGSWAGRPAWPPVEARAQRPTITAVGRDGTVVSSSFDAMADEWPRPPTWATANGPVVYARIDGGVAVFDPLRNDEQVPAFVFDENALWHGLRRGESGDRPEHGAMLANGLVRDLLEWSYEPQSTSFRAFMRAIGQLWEPAADGEPRAPQTLGPAQFISKTDSRRIPSLALPYANVPIVHLSGGMRRVLGLAYALVWTWSRHVDAAALSGVPAADRFVLLVDEVECHLHPRWQRVVLPALLDAAATLHDPPLEVQIVASTHSPLVAASVEPLFDEDRDRLLHLHHEGFVVRLVDMPWAKHTDANSWLTARPMGLRRPTAVAAERVLVAADAFMRGDLATLPPDLASFASIDAELRRVVAETHPVWVRWHYYYEEPRDDPGKAGA